MGSLEERKGSVEEGRMGKGVVLRPVCRSPCTTCAGVITCNEESKVGVKVMKFTRLWSARASAA